VHSIAKPFLIAAGALLILYAAAILFLNIYLQSAGVQTRMKEAVTRAIGTPAKVNHTYYTTWSGLTVSGITVPHFGGGKHPLLEVRSIKVHIRLPSLLRSRIVIKDICFLSPTLVATQMENGTWFLPPPRQSKEAQPESPLAVAPLEPPEPAPPEATPHPLPLAETMPPPAPSPPPEIVLESIRIRDGRASLYTRQGSSALQVEGVSLDASISSDGTASGTFVIGKTCIAGSLRPGNVTGAFESKGDRLRIFNLRADWADGRLGGGFDLDRTQRTFTSRLTLDDVSVKQLAIDYGFDAEGTRGHLFAKASLQGTPGEPTTFTGSAEANLVDARLEPIGPIRQLGELLRIDELRTLELKTAETNLTIRDGKVHVDRLVLASGNVLMDATGVAGLNGTLDLDAGFHVSKKLRKESRGLIGGNFQPSDKEGYFKMPFNVTGTLSRPKTDLLDKLVGIRIGQDVGGLLQNLIRMSQPQKKKKKDLPAPSGTPDR